MDQWKICIRDQYPAYIDWTTYERILRMIRDNRTDYRCKQTRGVPRAGKALLHGIVYCGECGHKMGVRYKRGPRYLCDFLRRQQRGPVCQYLPADAIDDYVAELFLAALAPAELDVYTKALTTLGQEEEQVRRARPQQIERLRYQARLAERQFNQADPTTAWWPPNWKNAGKRPCATSRKRKRRGTGNSNDGRRPIPSMPRRRRRGA